MKQGIIFTFIYLAIIACTVKPSGESERSTEMNPIEFSDTLEVATFGNGCFWCTEAVFQALEGVSKVESGYTGGKIDNPSYREICSGTTGHAEAVQIYFNPKVISYAELLEVFWATHDPTTLNRQGNDVGTQYRSVVFYHTEQQKELAEIYKVRLDKSGAYPNPIVTEITASSKFYVAEGYHQDYYELNGEAPYCQYVIEPKMDKLKKAFSEKLKVTN